LIQKEQKVVEIDKSVGVEVGGGELEFIRAQVGATLPSVEESQDDA